MRIPVLLTGVLAALLATMPLQHAPAQDDNAGGGEVSFDLFYNNLADDGDWYNTPEYGYVWQPFIAYKTESWRPYSDGYWAQTDSGWTWVSYENFGWATYHYGRWTRLKDIGWAWVPGYQWGPGWVSWRTNDDYVGWAPLPPKVERGVYEGKIVNRREPEREATIDYNDVEPEEDGYSANVDQDYDIGPANYCFVGTRSFGAPVLSAVLLPPERNVTIIERTTNVTNIYYNRERENVFVYNGGPRYDFVSAHSERPIPQLQIERVRNPSYLEEGLRAGGNPTQVRGGILQVAAPMIARRPVNFAQVKPARIKQTIERPEVVHGWSNTGANPEAVQQLHNRFKEQAQAAPAKAEAPKEQVVKPLPPEQRIVNRAPAPVPAQAGANGQPKDMSPEAVAARRAQRQQERAAQAGQPGAQPVQPGQPRTGAPAQTGPAKPGTPGQPLTEEDRVARRNAAQQARDARNNARPNGQPVPAQAGQPGQAGQPAANGQPKDMSPEAVAARRAQRQQERAAQGAKTPEQAVQPGANTPEQAAQPKEPSDVTKAARRAQRQQERAAQGNPQAPAQAVQPEARTPEQPAQPKDNSDEARAARRAQRQQQERAPQGAPPQANQERQQAQEQQAQQANQEREARQAQRQQAQRQQAQPQQAQPQQAQPQTSQQHEARQAQRQQTQQAPPAQQGNSPRGEHEGDRNKKDNKPNQ